MKKLLLLTLTSVCLVSDADVTISITLTDAEYKTISSSILTTNNAPVMSVERAVYLKGVPFYKPIYETKQKELVWKNYNSATKEDKDSVDAILIKK